MISCAIWNELAQVNFSKTKKIAQVRKVHASCSLWKIYECMFITTYSRKNRLITDHLSTRSEVFTGSLKPRPGRIDLTHSY